MSENEWLLTFHEAFLHHDIELTTDYYSILVSEYNSNNSDTNKKMIGDAYHIYLKYFFEKVKKCETFGDIKKFDNLMGYSIEYNYGLFEGPFICLAKTYWTFKLELNESDYSSNKVYIQILKSIEFDLATVFFPTPGPIKRNYRITKMVQKNFLEEYSNGIDINRLLTESPILKTIKGQPKFFLKLMVFLIIVFIIYLII